jgi:ketosteroid isomerase-like protein
MSHQNVEIARDAYAAFNRGEWDAGFASAAADFEWESDARLPNAGIYRGRAEIQRFFEDQAAPFESSVIEPERFIVEGDYVVALVKLRRKPQGSSAELEADIAHLWTFRDGRPIRGQAFAKREDALKAAGLSE